MNYIQKSEMILYCMFKNTILTFPQVFFAFYNGFSGHSFYDDLYIANFNFLFTALPYLIRALFDQDINLRVDGDHCRAYLPLLFRDSDSFDRHHFIKNALNAVI